MWWRSSALIAALFAGLAALALAGCGFQPLYGGTTAGGAKLAEVMAAVEIAPIPGRVGQKLRNELIFTNTGGGYAAPTRYKLDIAIKESVTDELVQITGDATGQVYQLDATFKLINPANGQVLFRQGASRGRPITASRKSSPTSVRVTMPRTAPPVRFQRASKPRSQLFSPTPPRLASRVFPA